MFLACGGIDASGTAGPPFAPDPYRRSPSFHVRPVIAAPGREFTGRYRETGCQRGLQRSWQPRSATIADPGDVHAIASEQAC